MTKELFFFPLALLLECLLFPLQLFPFCYIVLQKIKHFRCWWLGLSFSFWPFQFWGTASFSLLGITTIWIQSFNSSKLGVEDRVEDEEELPREVSNVKTGFTVGLSPMQSSISLWNVQVFFLPSGLTFVVFNFLLLRLWILTFPKALISSNNNTGGAIEFFSYFIEHLLLALLRLTKIDLYISSNSQWVGGHAYPPTSQGFCAYYLSQRKELVILLTLHYKLSSFEFGNESDPTTENKVDRENRAKLFSGKQCLTPGKKF